MSYSNYPWKRTSAIYVNLEAIRANIARLRAHLKGSPKVMAVVKADAYGHGIVEVADAVRDQVDWLAVNDIEEGIVLRNADVDLPILVFGVPDQETAELYSDYSLTATVSEMAHFNLLPAGTEYHINIDTGMGRLGFRITDMQELRSRMDEHPELMCTGIYSHFATSDIPDSQKVMAQRKVFKKIRSDFPEGLMTHLSNTGGAFFYEDVAFDMVRTGIGMYGYPPGKADLPGLRPALEWRSYLCQVKPIKEGETVSYGARWGAPGDGYIGVVPVGYSDGLNRRLSGKISFSVGQEHKVYPQVGRITMNYCMVYLGPDKLETGEEVHLVRAGEGTLLNWAGKLQTIPYELLTSLSPAIPRVYPK